MSTLALTLALTLVLTLTLTSNLRTSHSENTGSIHEHVNPFGLVSLHVAFNTTNRRGLNSAVDQTLASTPVSLLSGAATSFRWGQHKDRFGKEVDLSNPIRGFTITAWIKTQQCTTSQQQVGGPTYLKLI